MKRHRLEYLDFAKGYAILLVVMGHVIQYNLTGESSTKVFNFIYGFHMPLFFFLSGAVASLGREKINSENAISYIKKKATTLVLPFIVWGAIVGFLFAPQKTNFLDNFVLLVKQPDTGLWFLITLFIIQINFLIVALVGNYYRKNRFIAESLSIVFVLLVCMGGAFLTNMPLYFDVTDNFAFFAGYLFMKYVNSKRVPQILFPILLVMFCMLCGLYDFNTTRFYLKLAIAMPISILILEVSQNIELHGYKSIINIFTRLGRHSLEIYATHFYIIKLVFDKVDVANIRPIPLFLLLAVVSIALSYITIAVASVLSKTPYVGFLLYGKREG